MNKNSELELKWAADHLTSAIFVDRMSAYTPAEPRVLVGTDYYYRRGEAVLRYRRDDDGSVELTTKQRKSDDSIRDRVEVNVRLDPRTETETVEALLRAVGFKNDVALAKRSHVYRLEVGGGATAVIAFYVVDKVGANIPPRAFIEVEIEQDDNVPQAQAEALLDLFRDAFTFRFMLKEPLNESLYEMYSGRTYEKLDVAESLS
jgi:adenylate cyclase class IV